MAEGTSVFDDKTLGTGEIAPCARLLTELPSKWTVAASCTSFCAPSVRSREERRKVMSSEAGAVAFGLRASMTAEKSATRFRCAIGLSSCRI